MAQTFTQIIFPPKSKKICMPTPQVQLFRKGVLEFWFKEVIDCIAGTDLVTVMVKCPECGFSFPLMSIAPGSVNTMRECIHNNKTYYIKSVKSKCPSCKWAEV